RRARPGLAARERSNQGARQEDPWPESGLRESRLEEAGSAPGRQASQEEKSLTTEATAVSPEDVERAAHDLRPYLPPTPLQFSRAFTDKARCQVHLKIESVQPIRAFKVRGALNKVIHTRAAARGAGVITASAGNQGLGVAYAAATFATPATVYVPEGANPLKVEAIRRLGASVVPAGRNYSEANLEALAAQKETGATFVHAYDDPQVVAGQGTIGLEILAGLEDVDTVLVPIGGGGLIG